MWRLWVPVFLEMLHVTDGLSESFTEAIGCDFQLCSDSAISRSNAATLVRMCVSAFAQIQAVG